MTDIALTWNNDTGGADLALAGGDLLAERGLRTAVIISLFSDAQARSGDTPPDGTDDRRGWWGDLPLLAEADAAQADHIGSRLWLLDRAILTDATLRAAEAYAREALAWMVADGVADSVTASAASPNPGWLSLVVTITKGNSRTPFDFIWRNS